MTAARQDGGVPVESEFNAQAIVYRFLTDICQRARVIGDEVFAKEFLFEGGKRELFIDSVDRVQQFSVKCLRLVFGQAEISEPISAGISEFVRNLNELCDEVRAVIAVAGDDIGISKVAAESYVRVQFFMGQLHGLCTKIVAGLSPAIDLGDANLLE